MFPRGPVNELHRATYNGAIDGARSLILNGNVGINDADMSGTTPLIYAARKGLVPIIKLLLDSGARTSAMNESGFRAIHACAMNGDPQAMQLLVDSGAKLGVRSRDQGVTSLHIASQQGHWETARVLAKAGADTDYVAFNGSTALYMAAVYGHCGVIRVLLRANANPLIACGDFNPLEVASHGNCVGAVRELVNEVGIEGCGGPSGGVSALRYAAQQQSLESMEILLETGVVDLPGDALRTAVSNGCEQSVLLLLRRYLPRDRLHNYVNSRDSIGSSALKCCFSESSLGLSTHRIFRWLVDSGADFGACIGSAPPDNSRFQLLYKDRAGFEASEEKDRSIEALRRAVLTTSAARAVSWGWGVSNGGAAAVGGTAFAASTTDKEAAKARGDEQPRGVRWLRARRSFVPLVLCRYRFLHQASIVRYMSIQVLLSLIQASIVR